MTPEQFQSLLSQDLAAVAQRHSAYSNDGQRFTHWVLENLFLRSDNEARTANFDETNDGGLDGFFIDQTDELIRLIQCKYSSSIEREARESFGTLPHKLKIPERVAESNPGIYSCSVDFVTFLERNYDVHMSFVFNGPNRADYTDQMRALIRETLPEGERERFFVEVIGVEELMVRYLARNPFGLSIPDRKTLKFSSVGFLEYSGPDAKGVVVHVRGEDLAAFGNQPEMFLANFRHSLGLRNKVNSKISETIQEPGERAYIWAYNNGVTIICDDFGTPDLTSQTIQISRPQIVNGCQTVSTLNRPEVHRYSGEIEFLVRIVATTSEQLKRRVATYTNSQTKVTDRNLRSNDPIQKELQVQFVHLQPPYFYDCKEGEWEALPLEARQRFQISGRNYRWISNIDAAKAFLAFEGKPVEAKSSPRVIWDVSPQGFYNTIFSSGRLAEELLLPQVLSEHFVAQVEHAINAFGEEPSGDDAVIKESLGHADTTLLALAGFVIRKKHPAISAETLRDLIRRTPSFSQSLFERCFDALKLEILREKNESVRQGQLFVPRNFFLRSEVLKNARNQLEAHISLLTPEAFYRRCGLVQES